MQFICFWYAGVEEGKCSWLILYDEYNIIYELKRRIPLYIPNLMLPLRRSYYKSIYSVIYETYT